MKVLFAILLISFSAHAAPIVYCRAIMNGGTRGENPTFDQLKLEYKIGVGREVVATHLEFDINTQTWLPEWSRRFAGGKVKETAESIIYTTTTPLVFILPDRIYSKATITKTPDGKLQRIVNDTGQGHDTSNGYHILECTRNRSELFALRHLWVNAQ